MIVPTLTATEVSGDITEGTTLNDSGSISFADLDLTDTPTATEATKSVTALRADGTTALTLTAAQQAALEAGFSITPADDNTNDGTINWDYTVSEDTLNFLAAGEAVTATFTITVDDGNGGTSSQDVEITINGTNDVPTLTATEVSGDITEGTTLNDSGSIAFEDLDLTDTPTATEATKSVTLRADGTTALTLTAAQQAALEAGFSITPADDNTNDGTINWDYTVSENTLNFLAAGEAVTATFTITVDDGNGGTSSQDVEITINGTNDVPTLTATEVSGDITEGTTLNDSGSISFEDLDLTDTPTATEATKSVTALRADGTTALTLTAAQQAALEAGFSITPADDNTNDGTINWDYTVSEDTLNFLAAGEEVTATFTITVDDGNGGTSSQDIEITINGTNDVPTIENATNPAAINELAGDSSNQDIAPLTGTISVNDKDVGDSLTVSVTGDATAAYTPSGGAAGNLPSTVNIDALLKQGAVSFDQTGFTANGNTQTINWTYDPDSADLDWLAEGDSLTLTFIAQVDDGYGNTGEQNLVITINGTNDVPTIENATNPAAINELAGDSSNQDVAPLTGTISINDKDIGDSLTVSVTGDATAAYTPSGGAAGNLPSTVNIDALLKQGAISFDQTGFTANGTTQTINWTYDPDSADLDWLAEGDSLTVTFIAQVDDGYGNTGEQNLVITINGTNDVPQIQAEAEDINGAITEASGMISDSGTLRFTDIDQSDKSNAATIERNEASDNRLQSRWNNRFHSHDRSNQRHQRCIYH